MATPMPNCPKDKLGHLILLWHPESAYQGSHTRRKRYGIHEISVSTDKYEGTLLEDVEET